MDATFCLLVGIRGVMVGPVGISFGSAGYLGLEAGALGIEVELLEQAARVSSAISLRSNLMLFACWTRDWHCWYTGAEFK